MRRTKKTVRTANTTDSLDEMFQIFYQAQVSVGRAKSTLKGYVSNYAAFCNYLGARGVPRLFSHLSTELGRDYVIWLRDEKVKFDEDSNMPSGMRTVGLLPKSVNTRLKLVKGLFSFLVEEGIIREDPFYRVKPVADVGRDIHVLTADELALLLKIPDQRRYAGFRDFVVLNVLIDGMVRIDEALTLLKSDIDMEGGVISLRKEVVKTRKARMVPLTKRTIRLIRELNTETAEFGSDYVFLTNIGKKLHPDHFGKRLRDYGRSAGLDKRTYSHLMRHSGATLFLETGGSARHLQMILGHSSSKMTNHYTHLSNTSVKRNHDEHSALHAVVGNRGNSRKIIR